MSDDTVQPVGPENYPAALEELAAGLAAHWADGGMEIERARALALQVCEYLRLWRGGGAFYVSKGESYELSLRDETICREWNNRNTEELCRRYDITERRLRQIVEAARKRRQAEIKL